jgi:hypothetical protein
MILDNGQPLMGTWLILPRKRPAILESLESSRYLNATLHAQTEDIGTLRKWEMWGSRSVSRVRKRRANRVALLQKCLHSNILQIAKLKVFFFQFCDVAILATIYKAPCTLC